MRAIRSLCLTLLLTVVGAPLFAYNVYLKDGSHIVAREAITIDGDTAIIVLQNGTRTSIDASEIDLERTQAANQENYGSAIILEESAVTELPASAVPKRRALGDLLARREANSTARSTRPTRPEPAPEPGRSTAAPGSATFRTAPRRPFRSLDLAAEAQRLFRAQRVEEILVYQGTEEDHLLVDVTANSEASVFRALDVAADTLMRLRELYPGEVAALEIVLATTNRDSAGQFLLTAEKAVELTENRVEISTFFIQNVRF